MLIIMSVHPRRLSKGGLFQQADVFRVAPCDNELLLLFQRTYSCNYSTTYYVDRAPKCLGDVESCVNYCHEIGMMIKIYKNANASRE